MAVWRRFTWERGRLRPRSVQAGAEEKDPRAQRFDEKVVGAVGLGLGADSAGADGSAPGGAGADGAPAGAVG